MPQILLIDPYDSFTNNIVILLRETISDCRITIVHHDDPRFVLNDEAFATFLSDFVAVVAGPGPGHPSNPQDVGVIAKLWTLPEEHRLPVLGICLGFQSLCLAFGASVERLCAPRHGLVRPVTHRSTNLFAGLKAVKATMYHSLSVRLEASGSIKGDLWTPSRQAKEVLPLAWDLSDPVNGPVLMAAKHCHSPFWGVQYHPESVCSSKGAGMIGNWWREAVQWNKARDRRVSLRKSVDPVSGRGGPGEAKQSTAQCRVRWRSVKLGNSVDVANIVDLLRPRQGSEPMLLESGKLGDQLVNPETGRFSIIGLPDKDALQIRWSTSDHCLVSKSMGGVVKKLAVPVHEALSLLQGTVTLRRATDGPADVPFWGGLVGYISYEAGLETIAVPAPVRGTPKPDIWFTMVERSVVVDHVAGVAYVQSIREDDEKWLQGTETVLRSMSERTASVAEIMERGKIIAEPSKETYCAQISACQDLLCAGESYELCLTDQTLVRNDTDPWHLYRRLRRGNPAPFGAYFRASGSDEGVDFVGSSPERFASCSRGGEVEFRPIKGTVKKSAGTTREKAEEVLSSEKERAENLMIVDLIRHDLSGVDGYVSSPPHALPIRLLRGNVSY